MLAARVLTKWSKINPVCGIIVVKRKITAKLAVIFLRGGPEEIRTPDPHNANVMRSQLRYGPITMKFKYSFYIIAEKNDL